MVGNDKIYVRLPSQLKEEFENNCRMNGKTMSDAIRDYIREETNTSAL